MNSQPWVIGTLLTSIVLIVFTIIKLKIHPFLALLLASFYVGALMGMNPVEMVSAIERGVGGTLGFLAAVIGLVCGITLFVEVGVVLLIPRVFSVVRKTNTSLLKLAIPLCVALMAVHCIVPLHLSALFMTNKLGADIDSVIVYGLIVALFSALMSSSLFQKFLGSGLPFKSVPAEFSQIKVHKEKVLPSLGMTLFPVLLPIGLMLIKPAAELNMEKGTTFYTVLESLGNPIIAMFITTFGAYYTLGTRKNMGIEYTVDENGRLFRLYC